MIRTEGAANHSVPRSRIAAQSLNCAATEQLRLACVRDAGVLADLHYDSQIIAAALTAGCTVLYSEDMQHGQLIDGTLTIVNPFVA